MRTGKYSAGKRRCQCVVGSAHVRISHAKVAKDGKFECGPTSLSLGRLAELRRAPAPGGAPTAGGLWENVDQ